MLTATDQRLIGENTFALRTHELALREIRPYLAANLPQVWTEDQLAARWALTRSQVLAVLVQHAGLPPGDRSARVSIEVVLRLDDVVKAGASVNNQSMKDVA
jgi:hypothetical protein